MSNADASAGEVLFSPTLIPSAVVDTLPTDYILRPLARNDHGTGFLSVLADLTLVGEVTAKDFGLQFDSMLQSPGTYYIIVITTGEGEVVATGALIVERKL